MDFYNLNNTIMYYSLQRRWRYLMFRYRTGLVPPPYNYDAANAACGGGGGAHSQGTSGLAGGIHGVGSTAFQQQGAHNAGGIPGIGSTSFQQHETHNAGGIHEVGPSSFQQHGTYNAGGIHGVGSATFQQQGTHNAGGSHGVGSTNTGIHNFPSDNCSNQPYYSSLPENSSNPPSYPGVHNFPPNNSSNERVLPDNSSNLTTYSEEGTWCLFCLITVRGYQYDRRPYCGHYYHLGCRHHFPLSDFENCFLCSVGIYATEL